MSRNNRHRLRWFAAAIMIGILSTGLSSKVEAQETHTLEIKSIKPVPKLEKPKIENRYGTQPANNRTTMSAEEARRLRAAATGRLEGIDLNRGEIVIGGATWPLSPHVNFHIGDQVYKRPPSSFQPGRHVAYWLDQKTDTVVEMWLYDDIKSIVEDS